MIANNILLKSFQNLHFCKFPRLALKEQRHRQKKTSLLKSKIFSGSKVEMFLY